MNNAFIEALSPYRRRRRRCSKFIVNGLKFIVSKYFLFIQDCVVHGSSSGTQILTPWPQTDCGDMIDVCNKYIILQHFELNHTFHRTTLAKQKQTNGKNTKQ